MIGRYYEHDISDDDLIAAAEWYDNNVTMSQKEMTMSEEALKFQSMSISRHEYGSDKGRLRAQVKCSRFDTQLDVKLPDDIVLEIMRLIAPAIAAQVNAALLDVARTHENWMIEQDIASAAKELPSA